MFIDFYVTARDEKDRPRDPRATLDEARDADLNGILIVDDQNEVDRSAWLAARGEGDPAVFFGELAVTARARLLAIPRDPQTVVFPPRWRVRAEGEPLTEEQALAQAARSRAAIVVVTPYERDSGEPTGDLVFALAGIRGVLVYTCGTNTLAADLAVEAGTGMRLPCLAGTGRTANGRVRLGTLATAFAREVSDQGSLVEALLEGDAWPIHIERPASSRPPRGSSAEDAKRRPRRPRKRD